MGVLDFLTTESGETITTESGEGILVQAESSNDDIQIFDFSVNLLQALLWQYNVAENLQALLEAKDSWYQQNQEQFWTDWVRDVFDLRTANNFGLAVWSIILGQPIFINNGPDPITKPTFGFGQYYVNFSRGNFSSQTGNTYQLPTETARLLLQLRYFQLVSSGTPPETNRMLSYLFSDQGPAYILDGLNMTQRYVFLFKLSSQLILLFDNFDVLPRPAAVKSTYYDATIPRFGFGSYHVNFNRGNFGP